MIAASTTPAPPTISDTEAGGARRGVLAVAVTGTVFIALAAFWLSFASLSDLARRCGIGPDLSWVWPLLIDGVIVIATVSVVALTGARSQRRAASYPWVLLLSGAGVSVLANASHAVVAADASVPTIVAALVATVPPVVLVAATHLTVVLTRDRELARSADAAACPVAAVSPASPPSSPELPVEDGPARRGHGGRAAPAGDPACRGAEARRLRERGWTNRRIAAELGVHPSTVGRWFTNPPPPVPPAQHPTDEPGDQASAQTSQEGDRES